MISRDVMFCEYLSDKQNLSSFILMIFLMKFSYLGCMLFIMLTNTAICKFSCRGLNDLLSRNN